MGKRWLTASRVHATESVLNRLRILVVQHNFTGLGLLEITQQGGLEERQMRAEDDLVQFPSPVTALDCAVGKESRFESPVA